MKITDSIISIPPYLSTTWDNVFALHTRGDLLVVTLKDGALVEIPALPRDTLDQIFQTHATYLEAHADILKKTALPSPKTTQAFSFEQFFQLPLRIGTIGMEGISLLQHTPAMSTLPPLPPEIASKIAALGVVVAPDDLSHMPPAEEGCNCLYCQIHRILHQTASLRSKESLPPPPRVEQGGAQALLDEQVSPEELRFEEWAVSKLEDEQYLVTNKLDLNEQYTVSLNEPVTCTCGHPHCEHIVAVLRS